MVTLHNIRLLEKLKAEKKHHPKVPDRKKKKKIQRFEKIFLDRFNKQITTILTYCGAVEELSKQIYIN